MYEHCGVIGIYSLQNENIVPMLLSGLESLQHRGQESWGIAVPKYDAYKKMGIVSFIDELTYKEVTKIQGNVGVGHVRYTTTSKSSLENAHPLKIGISKKFYLCHNGTLERDLLISYLKKTGFYPYKMLTDTELFGIGLYQNRKKGLGWTESFERMKDFLNGSFCLTILTENGNLVAARDERGYRPLCLGWHKDSGSYIVASESCALDRLNAKLVRDVKAGEIIEINKEKLISKQFVELENQAHCAFEFTYFAHPSSYIQGKSVYDVRKNIGKALAKKYLTEGEIVIPVPDSARPAALGFSEETGIPFAEGLMKDRYRRKGSWRSFIEPEKREEVILNITSVASVVKNKKIILIDDSIVRGTSSKIIIRDKLKEAKSISLFLTFPPIMYPCYMGIDFPTQKELLAFRKCGTTSNLNEINRKVAEEIGVKFIGYNDIDTLSKGIGISQKNLCLACTTGDYSCLRKPPKFKTKEEMKC